MRRPKKTPRQIIREAIARTSMADVATVAWRKLTVAQRRRIEKTGGQTKWQAMIADELRHIRSLEIGGQRELNFRKAAGTSQDTYPVSTDDGRAPPERMSLVQWLKDFARRDREISTKTRSLAKDKAAVCKMFGLSTLPTLNEALAMQKEGKERTS